MRTLVEETRGRGARAAPGELARLPDRHHDRAAARRAARRRAGRVGRLLLLRHQRPHPDRDRPLARRRREPVPRHLPRGRRARAQPVPDASTRRASASSSRSGSSAGARSSPGLKLGVCGEHGGDPTSVAFFHRLGLDYVSCSPFRVPTARLAAARAALEHEYAGRRVVAAGCRTTGCTRAPRRSRPPRASTSVRDPHFPQQRSTGCASTSRSAPRRACSISLPGPGG